MVGKGGVMGTRDADGGTHEAVEPVRQKRKPIVGTGGAAGPRGANGGDEWDHGDRWWG
jgi:hypothetical protein